MLSKQRKGDRHTQAIISAPSTPEEFRNSQQQYETFLNLVGCSNWNANRDPRLVDIPKFRRTKHGAETNLAILDGHIETNEQMPCKIIKFIGQRKRSTRGGTVSTEWCAICEPSWIRLSSRVKASAAYGRFRRLQGFKANRQAIPRQEDGLLRCPKGRGGSGSAHHPDDPEFYMDYIIDKGIDEEGQLWVLMVWEPFWFSEEYACLHYWKELEEWRRANEESVEDEVQMEEQSEEEILEHNLSNDSASLVVIETNWELAPSAESGLSSETNGGDEENQTVQEVVAGMLDNLSDSIIEQLAEDESSLVAFESTESMVNLVEYDLGPVNDSDPEMPGTASVVGNAILELADSLVSDKMDLDELEEGELVDSSDSEDIDEPRMAITAQSAAKVTSTVYSGHFINETRHSRRSESAGRKDKSTSHLKKRKHHHSSKHHSSSHSHQRMAPADCHFKTSAKRSRSPTPPRSYRQHHHHSSKRHRSDDHSLARRDHHRSKRHSSSSVSSSKKSHREGHRVSSLSRHSHSSSHRRTHRQSSSSRHNSHKHHTKVRQVDQTPSKAIATVQPVQQDHRPAIDLSEEAPENTETPPPQSPKDDQPQKESEPEPRLPSLAQLVELLKVVETDPLAVKFYLRIFHLIPPERQSFLQFRLAWHFYTRQPDSDKFYQMLTCTLPPNTEDFQENMRYFFSIIVTIGHYMTMFACQAAAASQERQQSEEKEGDENVSDEEVKETTQSITV